MTVFGDGSGNTALVLLLCALVGNVAAEGGVALASKNIHVDNNVDISPFVVLHCKLCRKRRRRGC